MAAYTINNNKEALVVVFKEAGLDVSAEEIKLCPVLCTVLDKVMV
jgi:hypothetical protein